MTTNATTTTKSNNKKTKKKKKMSKIIETKTNENDEKKGKKSDDAMEEEEENDDVNDDFNNTNINNEKTFTTIPEHIKTLALNQKENLARLLISASATEKICSLKNRLYRHSTAKTFSYSETFESYIWTRTTSKE